MASTVFHQQIAPEYYNLSTSSSQNSAASPTFNLNSRSYTDPAIFSDDSIFTTPTTPESFNFSDLYPDQEKKSAVKSEEVFDFGTFDDWMNWDDVIESKLSSSTTPEFFPYSTSETFSPTMDGLELHGSGVGLSNRSNSSRPEDDVVFIEDPVLDEGIFRIPDSINSPRTSDIPPREGLYSTPLSWTRPTLNQVQSFNSILSPAEELKLRDIAMPPSALKSESYPASPSSYYSPEPAEQNKRKKRKPSAEEEEDDDEELPPQTNGHNPPLKKTAHNMIEKRYRTNLNDKIAALRDSVPSLRVISKTKSLKEDTEEDLQGLTPAHKLNKATVLSKATEYIAHLEKRNRYLAKENAALKARVDAFEILILARQPQQQQQAQQQAAQQQRNQTSRQGSQGWMR